MAFAPAYQLARQYQRTQTETASPVHLVVMLYDGMIRFLSLARDRMVARDREGQNTYLIRAQRILSELIGTLDKERGGDVAANLLRVYGYMMNRLVEANMNDRTDAIDEVVTMLRELRESWAEVERIQTKDTNHAAAIR